jgi:hypothetical protein
VVTPVLPNRVRPPFRNAGRFGVYAAARSWGSDTPRCCDGVDSPQCISTYLPTFRHGTLTLTSTRPRPTCTSGSDGGDPCLPERSGSGSNRSNGIDSGSRSRPRTSPSGITSTVLDDVTDRRASVWASLVLLRSSPGTMFDEIPFL